jgi:hypothetical protein
MFLSRMKVSPGKPFSLRGLHNAWQEQERIPPLLNPLPRRGEAKCYSCARAIPYRCQGEFPIPPFSPLMGEN